MGNIKYGSVKVIVACVMATVLIGGVTSSESWADESASKTATHSLTTVIKLKDKGKSMAINTFCLDNEGNLLIACGGNRSMRVRQGNQWVTKQMSSPNELRVVDSQGQPIKSIALDFTPQALNVDEKGNVYVGGSGHLVKLNKEGKILVEGETPTRQMLLKNKGTYIEEEKKKAKAQLGSFSRMLEGQKTQVKKLEKLLADSTDESEVAKLKAQIKMYNQRLTSYNRNYEKLKKQAEGKGDQLPQSLKYKLNITGIAVTGDDVYIASSALKGYGYVVYRVDGQLKNPVQVAGKLRGCCGQLDIQAHDGKLYIAENSRKKVVCVDREGKKVATWGKDGRKAFEGFGSCCNPMNVRFGPKDVLYTSEASVGSIKMFKPNGDFIGLAAQAKDIPSCKHTPIGVNADGSKLYMLDVTQATIYVFAKEVRQAALVK